MTSRNELSEIAQLPLPITTALIIPLNASEELQIPALSLKLTQSLARPVLEPLFMQFKVLFLTTCGNLKVKHNALN